ncbi:MAG TPA: NRDE family protein [Methylomirabilota bacterium]|nr:NRDE family protein [Methylomirabilota bacterium]
MCLLALWVGLDPAVPLIAAANRDEFFGRPTAPPTRIKPGIVAGQDLQAGGTWLGVNDDGLFIAVTNRREPERTPESKSRGLLALDALTCRTLGDVEALVAKRTAEQLLAGFNLVAVNGGAGVCLHWDGTLRPVRFGAGLHVVSNNRDLDDAAMPEKKAVDVFSVTSRLPDEAALQELLRTHDGERPICKHEERYGTVSSTIYVERGAASRLLYAEGAPCRHTFGDYSGLLARGWR